MDYKRYRVDPSDRGPLLEFMLAALRAEGCTILRHTPPNEAPFRITFETPLGERMGILAYAFLATFTPTKNRPVDEHTFQIKYGSKDGKLHKIWQDPYGLYTTLFVGINPELGFFVGADPQMHNPTRFFIRLEFKQAHVDAIQAAGWHAWERKKVEHDLNPVEVLVGGTATTFLQYVRFERAAHGLDQGHRQLLAEHMGRLESETKLEALPIVPSASAMHALAREFEMADHEVLDLIASARRLKMAVRGWVAEEHLVRVLRDVPGVTNCARSDEEGGPDVTLNFRGSRLLTVQCKNVLRERTAAGIARIDFQRTRASKSDPCSRFYRVDDYDVIAACLHAVVERWEFSYALPQRLDPHKTCRGRLSNNVRVDERWIPNAVAVLGSAAGLS